MDKMKKTLFLCGVIMVFLLSCTHNRSSPEYDITNNIIYRNQKRLYGEGFYLTGTGGCYYPSIRYISDDYATINYQLSSIDEARRLFCTIFEMYEVPLNYERRIRPYLHNFPLTDDNIQIYLSFLNRDGSDQIAPFIESVHTSQGTLIFDSRDKNGKLVILHKEPFETAYAIYKKEKYNAP